MRIWSIHPKYLDAKGLVALWRETLLAKKVLQGRTKGYKNHPQLIRFANSVYTLDLIDQYLKTVFEEAFRRGYQFDYSKINVNASSGNIPVTKGQIAYEKKHLLKKLEIRDKRKFYELSQEKEIDPHPLFKFVEGEVEDWERL